MPGPEPSRGDARDRLSRISGLFLGDGDRRRPQVMLHGHPGDACPLRPLDLARALARLGHPATVIEPGHGTRIDLRLLPNADGSAGAAAAREPRGPADRPMLHTAAQREAGIVIVESAMTMRADPIPFVLFAVPADPTGMRRAWIDLKTFAGGRMPEMIGATITGAADLDEAEDRHARFAAAAERFLGMEVVSYACLLRNGQNREQELRNIAALLAADLANGAGAAKPEHIDEPINIDEEPR